MVRKRGYKGHSLVENVDDYTVLDIETTSLDSYYGEILEISAIKVRNKNKIGKILKQERKMLVNTLIVADVCLIILFILLAILGSPYQSWDYSDPEWSVIGTLWHSFEWVYFKVAPLMVIVITAILGIIFVKRNK